MIKNFVLWILLFLSISSTYGQSIKTIEPTLSYTPDISDNAANTFKQNKATYENISKIVASYPDYESAKKHLTKKQIEIFENEEEYAREDFLYVGPYGCSWYCGGGPDSIFASSELKPINNIDYVADNAHDFSLRTAWVEGVSGYGIGQSITYIFAKLSPPVTKIEIFNGYMKSEKTWKDNSRVKKLKFYIDNKTYAILNLKDTTALQVFEIGSHQGQKNEMRFKFEIVDVYKGDKYDDASISEIEFDGTGVHCFTAGTKVLQSNGEEKNIENVKTGDKILSYNLQTCKSEIAIVTEIASQKHYNLYELDFEGTKITVTDDHPFFYNGNFYSIIPNNSYGCITQKLSIGNTVWLYKNGEIKTVKLISIQKHNSCEETYTITKLDRNNLFFANDICVRTEETGSVLAETINK